MGPRRPTVRPILALIAMLGVGPSASPPRCPSCGRNLRPGDVSRGTCPGCGVLETRPVAEETLRTG